MTQHVPAHNIVTRNSVTLQDFFSNMVDINYVTNKVLMQMPLLKDYEIMTIAFIDGKFTLESRKKVEIPLRLMAESIARTVEL